MIIQIKSPDQSGIIARYTTLLFKNNANVLGLEQHVEDDKKLFYMRIRVDLDSLKISQESLKEKLENLSKELGASIRIFNASSALKVAVFATKEQ